MKKKAEIQTPNDVADLLVGGFDNWKQYGNVNVTHKGDLSLFSYNVHAVIENEWTPFELMSRGLIINNVTGEIVARPFDKFFNWFEHGRTGKGHIKLALEKMDGSLGILYRDNGKYKIATRGKFDGEQAEWATKFLYENYPGLYVPEQYTLLFEIIYPENRIIVDYGNSYRLVLLAIRNRFTGEYQPFFSDGKELSVFEFAHASGFSLPKVFNFNNIETIIEWTETLTENEEGCVIYLSDGSLWKFKGYEYLKWHKAVSGFNAFEAVYSALLDGDVSKVFGMFPNNLYDELNYAIGVFEDFKSRIDNALYNIHKSAPKNDRKSFALIVKDTEYAPLLFKMLDGTLTDRDIYEFIYKRKINKK